MESKQEQDNISKNIYFGVRISADHCEHVGVCPATSV